MSKDVRSAIESADGVFETTFNRGNAAGMATLYTTDGQLLPTGSGVVSGHDAIRDFWKGVMDKGVKIASLETVEVEGLGETAVEIGRYALGDGEGNEVDRGKYVVVWKNEDGAWKLHRDIWNTSVPAEG